MKSMWAKFAGALKNGVRAMVKATASASVWLVMFGLCGFAFIVAGTYMLLGMGWAFLICGLACLMIAGIIAKGLANA